MSVPCILQIWMQTLSHAVYIPEEEIQMAAECVERYSTLPLLRNKSKKILISPIRMKKCCQGWEETDILLHIWSSCKHYSCSGEQFGVTELEKPHLATPLPGN